MTSPMKAPRLHDELVLLDGSKRWPLPGLARVTASIAANVDTQNTPGEGDSVTQMNEATGEVSVDLLFTTHEQWQKFQSLLKILRRGTKTGPAVFTSAHPEIKGRGIKRLYFVSESPQPFNPKDGYRTTIRFSEKLKDKTSAASLDSGTLTVLGQTTPGAGGGQQASTVKGQAVYDAAIKTLTTYPPEPANGGKNNISQPGFCSAYARVVGQKAGLPASLFGASALQTEGNFRRANLSVPWNADSQKNLEQGDYVFWANDPSGYGHVGVVVGKDSDGMPLIAGNNLVTAGRNGGKEARGIVRLDQLSTRNSQPTSVGKPGGVSTGPRIAGPAVPVGVPLNAPSRTPLKPPGR